MNIFIPKYLSKFKYIKHKILPIDKCLVGENFNNKLIYRGIENTIHYRLISDYINNKKNISTTSLYLDYIAKNKQNHKLLEFYSLADDIIKNGYNYEIYPILVFKNYRNIKNIFCSYYCVIDGFHRLSILKALGFTKINIAVMKYIR